MKRICAALALVLLCFAAIAALADDYGTAVISGGSEGKVHLREEPSFEADSKGLYFTGTQVKLLEEMDGKFTRVRIGVESGYMYTSYLKRGKAGDAIRPKFWEGVVTATNYANMRRGPSTEYQFLGRIDEGETITIMGETSENWYYIEEGGKEGYISARLVSTDGAAKQPEQSRTQAAEYDAAYSAYASVMRGRLPFLYVPTMSAVYIRDIGACFDLYEAAEPERYSMLNMDADDAMEIVVGAAVGGSAYGYIVLDEQNGTVYGYPFVYRGMLDLKADGSFSYSSGAADSGFGAASFIGQVCRVTPAACTESTDDGGIAYYIGGAPVTRAAYERACDAQNAKTDALWMAFTDVNLRARFGN